MRGQLEALEPMLREGCAGQLPEIYDGDQPTAGKGEITAANALEKTDLWNEAINNTGL